MYATITFNPKFSLEENDKQNLLKVKEILKSEKIKETLELEVDSLSEPRAIFAFLNIALTHAYFSNYYVAKLHDHGLTKRWLEGIYRKLTYHYFFPYLSPLF